VLQRLGARVIAVDKAALDPRIAALPCIEIRKVSAFALDPIELGPIDWLFSDVVCYPQRLLTLIEKFLAAGTVRNFVCTIKFQGETDFATQTRFGQIPGATLLHLHNNKHELTWVKLGEQGISP
jgi:23S rRNA (cytidine2498-2'-O)-methyltransferase